MVINDTVVLNVMTFDVSNVIVIFEKKLRRLQYTDSENLYADGIRQQLQTGIPCRTTKNVLQFEMIVVIMPRNNYRLGRD